MSDFLFACHTDLNVESAEAALRDRPYMADAPIASFRRPGGVLVAQSPRGMGYRPYERNERVVCCAGRPRIVGVRHEAGGDAGFNRLVAEWIGRDEPQSEYSELTGPFALCACDAEELRIVTDRMGMFPVYMATEPNGRIAAVGTHPELVAHVAGRVDDVDPVSIGELLIRQVITFPYTTRASMRELEPGGLHVFTLRDGSVRHSFTRLWLPHEPARWMPANRAAEALESAIRFAGEDITRGSQRVGVTLSGGLDSRTVFAAIPERVRDCAVTYLDWENHEFRVARQVAEAAGVRHLAAPRDPEFYADLAERETALLGGERAVLHAHGFAVRDAGLGEEFDLIVGGFASDALLKGGMDPLPSRDNILRALRLPDTLRRRWSRVRPDSPEQRERGAIVDLLRPEIAEAIKARRRERLEAVQKVRPRSAEEWMNIWPMSRDHEMGQALASFRLLCSNQLFMHRDIIEIALRVHVLGKQMERLIRPAFLAVLGPLAYIENANRRVPPRYGWLRERLAVRLSAPRRRAATAGPGPDAKPWFRQDSWIDYRLLQLHSDRWQQLRQRALASERGIDMLGTALRIDPRELLKSYHEPIGQRRNHLLVQLALHFGDEARTVATPATR